MTDDQREALLAFLEGHAPEALLLEPRDVFDVAIVGVTSTPLDDWTRTDSPLVVIYDYERCVDRLIETDEVTREDALEHMDFNVTGAWLGRHTPTFARSIES